MTRLLAAAEAFEPRGRLLSVARSLLAFAELTVLLANPDRLLFGAAPIAEPGQLCSGIGAPSLWCLTGSDNVSRIIALTVLSAVMLGLSSRWTCIPHWYVAFSLSTRMVVPNGGEDVAQIMTLLLIPICLGDTRRWHWQRLHSAMAPTWRGCAYAGNLMLRCQISIIYLDAAISKLEFHAWRSGAAVSILMNDPHFGVPLAVRAVVENALASGWIGSSVTWAVLVMEISIGIAMLFGGRARPIALALAICLHFAIIIGMGLFSFGLVMISLVMASCAAWPLRSVPDEAVLICADAHQAAARTVVQPVASVRGVVS